MPPEEFDLPGNAEPQPEWRTRIWKLCMVLVSGYLRSDWDVLDKKTLLPAGTLVDADISIRNGTVYMGRLEAAKTSHDGSLVYVELSSPTVRATSKPATLPLEIRRERGVTTVIPAPAGRPPEPYRFQASSNFVIFATDISNINFRYIPRAVNPPVEPQGTASETSSARPSVLAEDLSSEDRASLLDELDNTAGIPSGKEKGGE